MSLPFKPEKKSNSISPTSILYSFSLEISLIWLRIWSGMTKLDTYIRKMKARERIITRVITTILGNPALRGGI